MATYEGTRLLQRSSSGARRYWACALLGAALACGSISVLAAEEAQKTESGPLEEVVVTAQYREENLQTTPLAITAITSQDLEQRGFSNSSDVALTVPNAAFRPAQAAYGNTMTAYIRGIGQYDFNFAFEPGVAVYVDDVYYPTVMSSQFDLMDLERVEVLRGPQGTLFGRGAIGGAIRYVSKRPGSTEGGFIEGTYGQRNRVDVRAGFDFAMIPDRLYARVTAMSKKENGYVDRIDFVCAHPELSGSLPAHTRNRDGGCKLGTLGGTDVSGARLQLRYTATDNLEFGASADFQRDDSESRADVMVGIVPIAPCPAAPAPCGGASLWDQVMFDTYGVRYDSRFLPPNLFTSYGTFDDPYSGLAFSPKTSLNQRGVSGTADWKITDAVSAKLIVAWRKWSGYFSTDQDESPLGFSVVDGIQHFQYTTQELRFSGRLFDRLDWTAGLFRYNGNSRSAQQVELPAFMGPRAALYYNDPTGVTNGLPNALLVNGLDIGHFENQSGFVHGIFDITDAFHLTLGGRYSKDKKNDLNDNSVVVNTVAIDKTRFDWRVGLDYQINSDTMVYASASTGYRPAAFNPRPFQPTQFVGVKGENLVAYELGAKADMFEKRLRINAALFYTDYKQRILPAGGVECGKNADGSVIPGAVPNPEGGPPCAFLIPLTAYINAPAKIKGGELELAWRPVDPLLITGSYGYNKYTADPVLFRGNPVNGLTANGQGIFVPKYNWSAAAQWTFNLGNGGTITPRWDAYQQAKICSSTTTATSCTDAYVLHNARLEYASQDRVWTVALGATNVTDKTYLLNIFDLSPFGEPTIEGQPGEPRSWYITATHKFGGP